MLWRLKPERYQGSAHLEERLGYFFKERDFLFQAMTHRSALAGKEVVDLQNRPWNERLEFLGDAALGLVMTEHLFNRYPQLSEGDLSKMRAALICEENLAAIGKHCLGVDQTIVLGESELASNGREKVSLIADAVEALLGAVFLDGGWAGVREVTLTLFSQELTKDPKVFLSRDAKTRLQEYVQGSLQQTPTYEVISEDGPAHARTFEVVVKVGTEIWGHGFGLSKKIAAQHAAEFAISQKGVGEVI